MPLSFFHKFFRASALLFFLAGTYILVAFLVTHKQNYVTVGYVYTKLAFSTNYILLLMVLLRLLYKPDKRNTLITAGIMLLNIPVVLLYMYIVGKETFSFLPYLMNPFKM